MRFTLRYDNCFWLLCSHDRRLYGSIKIQIWIQNNQIEIQVLDIYSKDSVKRFDSYWKYDTQEVWD